MNSNIFLIGFMGAGKTTIGRILAKKLNKRFIDSDQEIEDRTGTSIQMIFKTEGEDSFRHREVQIISELSKQYNIILATGGGAILNTKTRSLLKKRGTVIYLRTKINQILKRTIKDSNRPLLQPTINLKKRLEQLLKNREPYYKEIADLIFETNYYNIQSLVKVIINKLISISPYIKFSMHTQSLSTNILNVKINSCNYPITIGHTLLTKHNVLLSYIAGKYVAIVTNEYIASLYLEKIKKSLEIANKQVIVIILPDGEKEKNFTNLIKIFDKLLINKCDRETTLIALGGGVIGDLTGFAAASYMRGVSFIQIPTTLLAQVDSSIGGKTGINHSLGKNMIGAFYQPKAVITDIATLKTLPNREFLAGLAEVIKYGIIIDAHFFNWIETNLHLLITKNNKALLYIIKHSCKIKMNIVRQDEREGNIRAILNFGHTFGHAIESGLGYGTWLHGEAVSCGMVMATDLSYRLGYIDTISKNRVITLIKAAGLPIIAPNINIQNLLNIMKIDKKNKDNKIKFVLLKSIGTTCFSFVTEEIIKQTIIACTNRDFLINSLQKI